MSAISESESRSTGVVRGLAVTMPIVLAGSMAVTGLGAAPAAAATRTKPEVQRENARATVIPAASPHSSVAQAVPASVEIASVAPHTYTVVAGDTVSGIAARFGLSTASVLALNGLSWKSLIFPKQVLRLSSAAAPATKPAPKPAPASTAGGTRYTIVRGDTVTSIAHRFGVTISAILSANGLVASSIIYAGRTLVIPGRSSATAPASTPPTAPAPNGGTAPAEVGSPTVALTSSMAANARTIIAVGKSRGVPTYGLVIALAAAMQESGLENLDYGDRDSVGLFQQRPSAGWGTDAQLENPTYAAELFFGGPSNPNKGRTRGLLDIPGWQSMSVTAAAQAVQVSATPLAYAKWEASARAWVAELG